MTPATVSVAVGEIYSLDDLLLETCAGHQFLDWEGVGEVVDGKKQVVSYTPETGLIFL